MQKPLPSPRVQILPSKAAEKKKIRVAAYCRISTDLLCQSTSIENQRSHYRDTISANPDWELVDIYWESGVSGTKSEKRPQLLRLLEDCEAGLVDMVLTKSISRFSRNTADCLQLVRHLSALGVALRFEKEQIQTDQMGTEFLLTILAAFAQDESRSISENMKWAIRRKFQTGQYRSSRAPYGYRKSTAGMDGPQYIIDPAEACVVRRIFSACLEGKGSPRIAEELNRDRVPTWSGVNLHRPGKWQPGTVLTILKNEFYVGTELRQQSFVNEQYRQVRNEGQLDRYLFEDAHEGIIGKDVFEQVQALVCSRRGNRSEEKRQKRTHGLSGKLLCGRCGQRLVRGRDTEPFWVCPWHLQKKCSMKPVREKALKCAYATMLNKMAFAEKRNVSLLQAMERQRAGQSAETAEIQNALTQVTRQQGLLCDRAAAEGMTAAIRTALDGLERERQRLMDRLARTRIRDTAPLRAYIKGRGILPGLCDADEDAMDAHLEHITVLGTGRMQVQFSCGLCLCENLPYRDGRKRK